MVASSVAGRADFFRQFRYEFASASLSVEDSDPFASGSEARVPRVTRKTLSLAPGQKKKIEEGLRALCPSEADLKQRCAPGGCVGLEILGPSTLIVQHHATALAAQWLFEPLFPEIRQMHTK